ncbi:hypothetical protein ES703_16315 [subsurface metagenome]
MLLSAIALMCIRLGEDGNGSPSMRICTLARSAGTANAVMGLQRSISSIIKRCSAALRTGRSTHVFAAIAAV